MWTRRLLYSTSAFIIMFLTGCQSVQNLRTITQTEARLTTKQLDHYKIDCSNPSQTAFLKSQRVSDNDILKNKLITTSPIGWTMSLLDGTLEERVQVERGMRTAVQRQLEYKRRAWCGG